jgi:S1-C subfamily serine protease
VTEIERGSPADLAGFQQGLIIEAIDGQVADSIVTLAKYLNSKKRGAAVRLALIVPGPFRRAEVELKVR